MHFLSGLACLLSSSHEDEVSTSKTVSRAIVANLIGSILRQWRPARSWQGNAVHSC